ncbi:hypothetical protein ACWEFD_34140 [Streptomyces ardesiacus]
MDYEETPILVQHLATAAAIVITYLTGMRPQEAQSLRSGCYPDPEPNPDGSTPQHLIRSRHYKNVRDSDGHHVSAGEERAVPWVAITPVVNAIRVLERLVPEGELCTVLCGHRYEATRGVRWDGWVPGGRAAASTSRSVLRFTPFWESREWSCNLSCGTCGPCAL